MKQRKITAVIKARFKKTSHYLQLSMVNFEEESIHHFRTEIKKLRAFLHLLNGGLTQKGRLRISKKIKTVYRFAGSIRNIQLHQKAVNEFISDSGDPPPLNYIGALGNQLRYQQEMATAFLLPAKQLAWRDVVRGDVPRSAVKNCSKKFMENKAAEFKLLLTTLTKDESVHSVRKLLKDILYNWKYVKAYKKLLPPVISCKKEIEALGERLGDFCDKTTGIQFLELYLTGNNNEDENSTLQKMVAQWRVEKETMRSGLSERLHHNPA